MVHVRSGIGCGGKLLQPKKEDTLFPSKNLTHCVHTRVRKGGPISNVYYTFEADDSTVAILQRERADYPTVYTQVRRRADLTHCVHF